MVPAIRPKASYRWRRVDGKVWWEYGTLRLVGQWAAEGNVLVSPHYGRGCGGRM